MLVLPSASTHAISTGPTYEILHGPVQAANHTRIRPELVSFLATKAHWSHKTRFISSITFIWSELCLSGHGNKIFQRKCQNETFCHLCREASTHDMKNKQPLASSRFLLLSPDGVLGGLASDDWVAGACNGPLRKQSSQIKLCVQTLLVHPKQSVAQLF